MKPKKKITRELLRKEIAQLRKENASLLEQLRTANTDGAWYELTDYFDPHAFQRISPQERVFFLGKLADALVCEVPEGSTPEQLQDFSDQLARAELTAPVLFVQSGVRFLRIQEASTEMQEELERACENAEATGARPDVVSSGSESESNGLDRGATADGEGHRGRSDPDHAGDAGGAQAAAEG